MGVESWHMLQPAKKCVNSYSLTFRLYKVSFVRLYKVCPLCGCEFDCHYFHGVCPYCGDNPNSGNPNGDTPSDDNLNNDNSNDPSQPDFVLFPELLVETSPLTLFSELAFYP